MGLIEQMREKIMLVADPNNSYTIEDFNTEFSTYTTPEKNKLKLGIVNKSNNPNPEYATNGSSGFDLRANLEDIGSMTIPSGEFKMVPTGLYFDIPENFEIQIRPRSGLAAKHGITVLNTPGTIDSDYTGEVKVILINHGKTEFTVQHGERIAQAVLASTISKNIVDINIIDEINKETDRGAGGFGSTGLS